ncbi:MAG: hypothetical protein HC765_02790 [Brachymonas sp.]|nr:hypothetical protein [Brachymonas sp.]
MPAATVDGVGNAAGDVPALANLGGAYMQAAAAMMATAIKTNLIANGAQRVLVLDAPNLTKVPAFADVTDPAAQGIVSQWSQAFNAKLRNDLSSESSKVLVVDFFGTLNGFVANPNTAVVGSVSLSDATAKACGNTDIKICTNTLLDASGPAGWRTHLFADGLHATPFGNELLAQTVRSAISTKGWAY